MSETEQIIITIYLVHGKPLKFSVDPSAAKLMGVSQDLEHALQRTGMAIEIDGKLMIIPYSNIQYVEFDPAPSGLPITIIQGAKKISD